MRPFRSVNELTAFICKPGNISGPFCFWGGNPTRHGEFCFIYGPDGEVDGFTFRDCDVQVNQ